MSDELKVFRCPKCSQYINSSRSECNFCHEPLTDEIIQKAIEEENKENKLYRRNMSKKHLLVGIGLFSVGVLISLPGLLAGQVSGGGGFIFIGLIFVGLAEIGNGLYGLIYD